ncbi:hypothetical protein JL720_6637 [Aureococcus anophagefferens]|nr:hypothetical protein JL720_6637 [Aureococcus anophagefferens]
MGASLSQPTQHLPGDVLANIKRSKDRDYRFRMALSCHQRFYKHFDPAKLVLNRTEFCAVFAPAYGDPALHFAHLDAHGRGRVSSFEALSGAYLVARNWDDSSEKLLVTALFQVFDRSLIGTLSRVEMEIMLRTCAQALTTLYRCKPVADYRSSAAAPAPAPVVLAVAVAAAPRRRRRPRRSASASSSPRRPEEAPPGGGGAGGGGGAARAVGAGVGVVVGVMDSTELGTVRDGPAPGEIAAEASAKTDLAWSFVLGVKKGAFDATLDALVEAQAAEEAAALEAAKARDAASAKLQARMRGKNQREAKAKQDKGAAQLQARMRAKAARADLEKKQQGAGKLQAQIRSKQARADLERKQAGASKLQAKQRSRLARREIEEKHVAATKLQSRERSRLARREMDVMDRGGKKVLGIDEIVECVTNRPDSRSGLATPGFVTADEFDQAIHAWARRPTMAALPEFAEEDEDGPNLEAWSLDRSSTLDETEVKAVLGRMGVSAVGELTDYFMTDAGGSQTSRTMDFDDFCIMLAPETAAAAREKRGARRRALSPTRRKFPRQIASRKASHLDYEFLVSDTPPNFADTTLSFASSRTSLPAFGEADGKKVRDTFLGRMGLRDNLPLPRAATYAGDESSAGTLEEDDASNAGPNPALFKDWQQADLAPEVRAVDDECFAEVSGLRSLSTSLSDLAGGLEELKASMSSFWADKHAKLDEAELGSWVDLEDDEDLTSQLEGVRVAVAQFCLANHVDFDRIETKFSTIQDNLDGANRDSVDADRLLGWNPDVPLANLAGSRATACRIREWQSQHRPATRGRDRARRGL